MNIKKYQYTPRQSNWNAPPTCFFQKIRKPRVHHAKWGVLGPISAVLARLPVRTAFFDSPDRFFLCRFAFSIRSSAFCSIDPLFWTDISHFFVLGPPMHISDLSLRFVDPSLRASAHVSTFCPASLSAYWICQSAFLIQLPATRRGVARMQ